MLIVKSEKTDYSGDVCLFNGEPLSGLSLSMNAGEVVRCSSFENGVIQGKSTGFPSPLSGFNRTLWVDGADVYKDEVSDLFYYCGKLFDGLILSFTGSVCSCLLLVEKGVLHGRAEIVDGVIVLLELDDSQNGIRQHYSWDKLGNLYSFGCNYKTLATVNVGFDGGVIRYIDSSGLKNLTQILELLEFPEFFLPKIINDVHGFSLKCHLMGSDITINDLYRFMRGPLLSTQYLTLNLDCLDFEILTLLMDILDLKWLGVETNKVTEDQARSLKSLYPECDFWFNRIRL